MFFCFFFVFDSDMYDLQKKSVMLADHALLSSFTGRRGAPQPKPSKYIRGKGPICSLNQRVVGDRYGARPGRMGKSRRQIGLFYGPVRNRPSKGYKFL